MSISGIQQHAEQVFSSEREIYTKLADNKRNTEMTSGSNSSFVVHNSSNFSNVSAFNVNVTEIDDSTESTTWDNKEIARIIHIIVRPTLIIFGTVGNTLSFYIMRRSSLKHLSTCFYMSILALADTGEWFSISIYAPSCAISQYHVFKIKSNLTPSITLNGTHSL